MNTESERSPKTTPTLGRLYMKWTALFTVGFVLGLWLPFYFVWDDSATGIGVGVFTAVWGAPGFGLMAAGAQWWKDNEAKHIGSHCRPRIVTGVPVLVESLPDANDIGQLAVA